MPFIVVHLIKQHGFIQLVQLDDLIQPKTVDQRYQFVVAECSLYVVNHFPTPPIR